MVDSKDKSEDFVVEEEIEPNKIDMNLELSVMRTALSCDRTLLSWVRTSLALIGFGFTLAKYIHVIFTHDTLRSLNIGSPRTIGIIMMIMGVAAVAGGLAQYLSTLRTLKKTGSVSLWTPACILAFGLLFAGGLLTFSILMKKHIF